MEKIKVWREFYIQLFYGHELVKCDDLAYARYVTTPRVERNKIITNLVLDSDYLYLIPSFKKEDDLRGIVEASDGSRYKIYDSYGFHHNAKIVLKGEDKNKKEVKFEIFNNSRIVKIE